MGPAFNMPVAGHRAAKHPHPKRRRGGLRNIVYVSGTTATLRVSKLTTMLNAKKNIIRVVREQRRLRQIVKSNVGSLGVWEELIQSWESFNRPRYPFQTLMGAFSCLFLFFLFGGNAAGFCVALVKGFPPL